MAKIVYSVPARQKNQMFEATRGMLVLNGAPVERVLYRVERGVSGTYLTEVFTGKVISGTIYMGDYRGSDNRLFLDPAYWREVKELRIEVIS